MHWKKKPNEHTILCPAKLFFKNERDIKTLSDRNWENLLPVDMPRCSGMVLFLSFIFLVLSELSASVLWSFILICLKYFHWSLLCFISFWYSHDLALYLFQLSYISCIVVFFLHLCPLCFSALEVSIDIPSNSLILASTVSNLLISLSKAFCYSVGFFCLFVFKSLGYYL